ncbi:Fc.00g011060.m01.CDS01 [Cosmosporella sp. VM-42]
MASSSRDHLESDAEYQTFLAEAKYAFCDLVKHKAERMRGRFGPTEPVTHPDDFKAMAGAVFDYLMSQASRERPSRGSSNVRAAIGPLMRKYTTDLEKMRKMEYQIYHFVRDYTFAGITDPDILNYYGHVNRVLRWHKHDKRYDYLANLASAIEFAAPLQIARGGQ